MATPWFFELLNIEATDDPRVVRRAYAAALKRIDQETQAHEFERLRRAYELAQEWQPADDGGADEAEEVEEPNVRAESVSPPFTVDQSCRGLAPTPVPVSHGEAPGGGEDGTPMPGESAAIVDVNAVFDAFILRLGASPGDVPTVLAETLGKDALIPLDARTQFESRTAGWLHEHRYPHHELFQAAARQFRWHDHLPVASWQVLAWLKPTVEQWYDWQATEEGFKATVLRGVEAAERGDTLPVDVLMTLDRALNAARARYPRWMELRLSTTQMDAWTAKVAKANQPTFWKRFRTILSNQFPAIRRDLLKRALYRTVSGLVLVIGILSLTHLGKNFTQAQAGGHEAPALASPLVSFKPMPALCTQRARLSGRWAQLYGNELTYRSFKMEVTGCLEAGLWPGGKTSADEYLARLKHAWRNPDDGDNASLDGLEPDDPIDDKHATTMVCARKDIDPNIDPRGAGCVALAGTFKKVPPPSAADRVPSFPVSRDFCADRADAGGNWHFDEHQEDQSYLSFKQEVMDCLANDLWPGGQATAGVYLQKLEAAWRRAKHPDASDGTNADDTDSKREKEVAGRSQLTVKDSTLTVGPRGRLVIGPDGIQIDGDVRVDGNPVSGNDPDEAKREAPSVGKVSPRLPPTTASDKNMAHDGENKP